jgi:hypothetical protein
MASEPFNEFGHPRAVVAVFEYLHAVMHELEAIPFGIKDLARALHFGEIVAIVARGGNCDPAPVDRINVARASGSKACVGDRPLRHLSHRFRRTAGLGQPLS